MATEWVGGAWGATHTHTHHRLYSRGFWEIVHWPKHNFPSTTTTRDDRVDVFRNDDGSQCVCVFGNSTYDDIQSVYSMSELMHVSYTWPVFLCCTLLYMRRREGGLFAMGHVKHIINFVMVPLLYCWPRALVFLIVLCLYICIARMGFQCKNA